MAFIGTNGIVTSLPNNGEKLCVACEYWCGARTLSYNDTGATSNSRDAAPCKLKHANVYPNSACSCNGIKFQKWNRIK